MDRRLLTPALGTFALGTDSFVIADVLPEISRAFGVGIGAAGQMTTVYAITYAVLAPTIAALAGSVPRKRLLLAGLSLFVVANLATAVSPNFGVALLTRALAGLGAAMFSPTAMGAGSMLVPPERRGFALAVIVAGLTTATTLGSPTGAVIGGLGDWRWTMVFVAALTPIVVGLNTSCTYFGVTTAGIVGALALRALSAHDLSLVGAGLLAAALLVSGLAARRIAAAASGTVPMGSASKG